MDKQSGESEEEEVNCEMTVLGVFTYLFFLPGFPSVLWQCWFGNTKGIRRMTKPAPSIPKDSVISRTWSDYEEDIQLNKTKPRCSRDLSVYETC